MNSGHAVAGLAASLFALAFTLAGATRRAAAETNPTQTDAAGADMSTNDFPDSNALEAGGM
jgi:hypothetical protein